MNILECFETEAFNELINFSFEEVRAVFNLNMYFVSPEQGDKFISEATQVKQWYTEELNKIEEYVQGEYTDNVNSRIEIPEYEEPQYKVKGIEVQTKRKLIGLITRYFNKDVFQLNKQQIYKEEIFKEETVETPHEMLVSLNVNKNRIYSLLSIIGYYQRRYGYFLSRFDFLKICYDYSNQVYFINKNLGMKYRFVNIFISSSRIKPVRKEKSDNNMYTDITNLNLEQFQSNKFIDIDKISLLMLIQPYLKHNTQEINKIIQIMMNNFNKYNGKNSWERTMDEVNEFIAECTAKGIMKRL